MKIDILTLFPEFFEKFLDTSIIKRAISKDAVEVEVHNIRDFTLDKNGRVDDYPLGGGAGLIMKCQPVLDCLKSIRNTGSFVALTASTKAIIISNTCKFFISSIISLLIFFICDLQIVS